MSSEITMNRGTIINQVPDKLQALVIVQGHSASGFGFVSEKGLDFRLTPHTELNLDRIWDVRVFGKWGEWHAWRMPDRTWRARKAAIDDQEWKDSLDREYALWGRQVTHCGDWYCISEQGRGVELYLPASLFQGLEEKDLPVRLKAKLRVSPDNAGVCGIVDVMFYGWEKGKVYAGLARSTEGSKGEDSGSAQPVISAGDCAK
jgi:CRISPR-associated protein (TIGR03984 family)